MPNDNGPADTDRTLGHLNPQECPQCPVSYAADPKTMSQSHSTYRTQNDQCDARGLGGAFWNSLQSPRPLAHLMMGGGLPLETRGGGNHRAMHHRPWPYASVLLPVTEPWRLGFARGVARVPRRPMGSSIPQRGSTRKKAVWGYQCTLTLTQSCTPTWDSRRGSLCVWWPQPQPPAQPTETQNPQNALHTGGGSGGRVRFCGPPPPSLPALPIRGF